MSELTRRNFLVSAVLPAVSLISSKSYASVPVAYTHLREWNADEIKKYSEWVSNLYKIKSEGTSKQKTARLSKMFSDDEMNLLNHEDFLEEGNPQISNSDLGIFDATCHCGSFPKLLHVYYANRRGLPEIITKINPGEGGDIRYTAGNHPVDFVRSMPFEGSFGDFVLDGITSRGGGYNFLTGNFRTAPDLEDTDSYPIEISRDFIVPGSLGYNVDGHGLVVTKLDDSGEIHFLDSHIGGSITFNQTVGSSILLINASLTDNPKKWHDGIRNLRLAKIENGRAVYLSNEESKQFGFSSEQYETMRKIVEARKKGGYELNGRKVMNYPQFVRARLQTGVEEPLNFLELTVQELEYMFNERALFVQQGWQDVLSNGAIELPNESSAGNIYQADGRWEIWSSPSSDVDRKQKYNYLATRLEEMVKSFQDSKWVDYQNFSSKKEMVEKLIAEKNRLFGNAIVAYNNSRGERVPLTLLDVEKRIFDLSFDPNHCPELRWGAPEGSNERYGMNLINTPLRTGGSLGALKAYELERGLRYYPLRQTGTTSLNPEDNPKNPPFGLIDERLRGLVDK